MSEKDEIRKRVMRTNQQEMQLKQNQMIAKKLTGKASIAAIPKFKTRFIHQLTKFVKHGN